MASRDELIRLDEMLDGRREAANALRRSADFEIILFDLILPFSNGPPLTFYCLYSSALNYK